MMTENSKIFNLENTSSVPVTPFPLFEQWLAEAEETEPQDANAMCVATVSASGQPQARIILLKDWDEKGFVFYGNRESAKGLALADNPVAALSFYWKSQDRQVRIEGRVEAVGDAESDAYYASRPRGSRIGAWASQQSRPLASRQTLAQAVKKYEDQFAGTDDIPRPGYWGGWRVIPGRIEFWEAGKFRLHTRLLYARTQTGWEKTLLYP